MIRQKPSFTWPAHVEKYAIHYPIKAREGLNYPRKFLFLLLEQALQNIFEQEPSTFSSNRFPKTYQYLNYQSKTSLKKYKFLIDFKITGDQKSSLKLYRIPFFYADTGSIESIATLTFDQDCLQLDTQGASLIVPEIIPAIDTSTIIHLVEKQLRLALTLLR